jgi:hypothetical protein
LVLCISLKHSWFSYLKECSLKTTSGRPYHILPDLYSSCSSSTRQGNLASRRLQEGPLGWLILCDKWHASVVPLDSTQPLGALIFLWRSFSSGKEWALFCQFTVPGMLGYLE